MEHSPIRQVRPDTHAVRRLNSLPALVSAVAVVGLLMSAGAAAQTTGPAAPTEAEIKALQEAKVAGRWSLLLAAVALLVVLPLALWIVALVARAISQSGKPWPRLPSGWVRSAIVGADKRVSTSKTAAVIWTYALATAVLSIVIAKWLGHPQAFDLQVKAGVQAEYGLLLGGTLGAAIAAKGIVSSQVTSGQSRPEAEDGAKASDLVNNDDGQTDLGDLQYVLFNTVAIVFFLGEFIANPQLGLPTIPDVLLGLTSVSAVGYVTKKALPSKTRTITKVAPPQVMLSVVQAGTTLNVYGSNLLNADGSAPPNVHFEDATGVEVPATKVVEHTTTEGLVLDAVFPTPNAFAVGKYSCVVVTAEGNKATKPDALEVVPG